MSRRVKLNRTDLRRLAEQGLSVGVERSSLATRHSPLTTRKKRPLIQPGTGQVLPPDDTLLRVRLPLRLTNGNIGRGGSFWASKKFRDSIQAHLIAWGLRRTPFEQRVRLHVIRLLGPHERLWDSDSWQRGNLKELVDALTKLGWWHTDGSKWIQATTHAEDSSHRADGPAVILEVRPAEPPPNPMTNSE